MQPQGLRPHCLPPLLTHPIKPAGTAKCRSHAHCGQSSAVSHVRISSLAYIVAFQVVLLSPPCTAQARLANHLSHTAVAEPLLDSLSSGPPASTTAHGAPHSHNQKSGVLQARPACPCDWSMHPKVTARLASSLQPSNGDVRAGTCTTGSVANMHPAHVPGSS